MGRRHVRRVRGSIDPEDQRNFVSGTQIGELTSDGNMDPTLQDYAQNINTIRNWTPNPQVGAFRWNTTAGTTRGTYGAGGGYEALNPYGAGTQATGSSYTVRDGETLQSIAASAWGDANLWYLIAEANGLSAGSALIGGQSLIVPDRVTDVRNNAGTFKVYDPAAAMGDLSPTTPKPPKKPGGCGAAGQIIATVIAVVVSKLIPIPIIGPVIGNLASQAFLIAIGQQSKINWKSVAITAISAGLAPPGTGNILADVVTSAAANAATQGIAVATGLQDKFSWAGVATAGAMAGVSGLVGRALPGAGAWDAKGALKIAPSFANATISSVIAGIAGAGARSILTGTSFGDNVRAVLPDVIAQTAGNMIGMSLQAGFQGSGGRGEAEKADIIAAKDARGAMIIAAKLEALQVDRAASGAGQRSEIGSVNSLPQSSGPSAGTAAIGSGAPAPAQATAAPGGPTIDQVAQAIGGTKGQRVAEIIARSPRLMADLQGLSSLSVLPWTIQVGASGDNRTGVNERTHVLHLGHNVLGLNARQIVSILAHEVGHAVYPGITDTTNKQTYVQSRSLEEGAAALYALEIRDEIRANGGPNIGYYGNLANLPAYEGIRHTLASDHNRNKAIAAIGNIYLDHEYTNSNTYRYKYEQEWALYLAHSLTPAPSPVIVPVPGAPSSPH